MMMPCISNENVFAHSGINVWNHYDHQKDPRLDLLHYLLRLRDIYKSEMQEHDESDSLPQFVMEVIPELKTPEDTSLKYSLLNRHDVNF
jgi:hypothetical protein